MGEKFVVYTAGNSGVRVKRYAQKEIDAEIKEGIFFFQKKMCLIRSILQ